MNRSLVIYDLVGAALVCGLAALGIWSGFFHLQASAERVDRARKQLATTAATLAEAETALRNEQAQRSQLAGDIARRGALPQRSPVEDDLRDVARIARDSAVELVQVTPLAGEKYPGLVELRYSVRARGNFAGLLGFLRDFEHSSLWADITGLQIGQGTRGEGNGEGEQQAEIILSLFAAQEKGAAP